VSRWRFDREKAAWEAIVKWLDDARRVRDMFLAIGEPLPTPLARLFAEPAATEAIAPPATGQTP